MVIHYVFDGKTPLAQLKNKKMPLMGKVTETLEMLPEAEK